MKSSFLNIEQAQLPVFQTSFSLIFYFSLLIL